MKLMVRKVYLFVIIMTFSANVFTAENGISMVYNNSKSLGKTKYQTFVVHKTFGRFNLPNERYLEDRKKCEATQLSQGVFFNGKSTKLLKDLQALEVEELKFSLSEMSESFNSGSARPRSIPDNVSEARRVHSEIEACLSESGWGSVLSEIVESKE